jgi:DNA-binding response OmpR family regulator
MGAKPEQKAKDKKLKAFVAHHDAELREGLEKVCLSLGFELASVVSHGIHAWKSLQKEAPDFIVASWDLPEISGIGL